MTKITTPPASKTIFKRRLNTFMDNFPTAEQRTKQFIGRIAAAEQLGSLQQDKRLYMELKRILALTKRTVRDLRLCENHNPGLVMPREAKIKMICVLSNTMRLLERIERLRSSSNTYVAQRQELDQLDRIVNGEEESLLARILKQ